MLQSCSSGDDSTGNYEGTTPSEVLLIKEIKYSDESVTKFIYNGNKIFSIATYENGYETPHSSEKFTYTGNLITKWEEYMGNTLNLTREYFYSNNKLDYMIFKYNYHTGNYDQGRCDFVYNPDNTVYKYYQNSTDYDKYYFDSNNNVIKFEEFEEGNLESAEDFSYDNKNTAYKNILGYDKLIFDDYKCFYIKNNIKNWEQNFIGSLGDAPEKFYMTYNYQYNNQNYPISFSILLDGNNYGSGQIFYY